jgi:Putative amidoligase enzyme
VEVVSPVLTGEAGVQEAGRVVAAMHAFDCTVSVRCGLHVHIYAGDLTLKQMKALAIEFAHAETAFDAIMPPSRRRDLNQYVLSNRTAFGGTYDGEGINCAIDAYNAATSVERLIETVASARPMAGNYDGSGTRFRKSNFEAFRKYHTVEFRQHSATTDPDKAMNWIRLCLAFVERSLTASPRKRTSTKPLKAPDQLAMLLKFLRLSPDVCKFYRERRRTFDDRTLERARRAAIEARHMIPAE